MTKFKFVFSSVLSISLLVISPHCKSQESDAATIKAFKLDCTGELTQTDVQGKAGDFVDYQVVGNQRIGTPRKDANGNYTFMNYRKPCSGGSAAAIQSQLSGKIDYVFVLMLENRSFDSYFGRLPAYLKKKNPNDERAKSFSEGGIDVPAEPFDLSKSEDASSNFNDKKEKFYWKHHSLSQQAKKGVGGGLCVSDTAHDWWAIHLQLNGGGMDGFVTSNDNYYEGEEPKPPTDSKDMLLNGKRAMLYYDQRDIPFFYWLADNFAIGDRYFSSVLGPTWVNRDYLYAGTSRGLTSNYSDSFDSINPLAKYIYAGDQATNPKVTLNNITELLEASKDDNGKKLTVSYWLRDLSNTGPLDKNGHPTVKPAHDGSFAFPKIGAWKSIGSDSHVRSFDYGQYDMSYILESPREQSGIYRNYLDAGVTDQGFYTALTNESAAIAKGIKYDDLSAVNFIDPKMLEDVNGEDDHPPATPINGQKLVYQVVKALTDHPEIWKRSVLFITYDEHGGFYDHVVPPKAVAPDKFSPKFTGRYHNTDESWGGDFTQYGMRVPFIVVSPWVKHHYVSHQIYDHTSILRFIEARWDLPALTDRDANANPMLDMFDFTKKASFDTEKNLAGVVTVKPGSLWRPGLPDKNALKAIVGYENKIAVDSKTKKMVTKAVSRDPYFDKSNATEPKGFVPPVCKTWFKPDSTADALTGLYGYGEDTYLITDWSDGKCPKGVACDGK